MSDNTKSQFIEIALAELNSLAEQIKLREQTITENQQLITRIEQEYAELGQPQAEKAYGVEAQHIDKQRKLAQEAMAEQEKFIASCDTKLREIIDKTPSESDVKAHKQKLNVECQLIESEIKDKEKKYNNKTQEIDEAKAQREASKEEFEKKLADEKQRTAHAQQEIDDKYQQKITALKQDLKAKEEQQQVDADNISKHQQKIAELTEQQAQLVQQKEELENKIAEQSDKLKQFITQQQELLQQQREFEKRFEEEIDDFSESDQEQENSSELLQQQHDIVENLHDLREEYKQKIEAINQAERKRLEEHTKRVEEKTAVLNTTKEQENKIVEALANSSAEKDDFLRQIKQREDASEQQALQKIADEEQEIAQLKAALAEQADDDNNSDDVSNEQQRIAERQKIAELTAKLQETKAQQEQQHRDAAHRIKKAEIEYDKKLNDLEDELQNLRAEKITINAALQQELAENSQAEQKALAEQQGLAKQYKEKIAAFETQLDEIEQQISVIETQQHERKVQQIQKRQEKLHAQHEVALQLIKKLEDLSTNKKEAEKTNQENNIQLDKVVAQQNQLHSEKKSLSDEIARLQGQVESDTQAAMDIKSSIQAIENKASEEKQELAARLVNYEQEVKNEQKDKALDIQEKLIQLEQSCRLIINEIKDSEKKLGELKSERDRLDDRFKHIIELSLQRQESLKEEQDLARKLLVEQEKMLEYTLSASEQMSQREVDEKDQVEDKKNRLLAKKERAEKTIQDQQQSIEKAKQAQERLHQQIELEKKRITMTEEGDKKISQEFSFSPSPEQLIGRVGRQERGDSRQARQVQEEARLKSEKDRLAFQEIVKKVAEKKKAVDEDKKPEENSETTEDKQKYKDFLQKVAEKRAAEKKLKQAETNKTAKKDDESPTAYSLDKEAYKAAIAKAAKEKVEQGYGQEPEAEGNVEEKDIYPSKVKAPDRIVHEENISDEDFDKDIAAFKALVEKMSGKDTAENEAPDKPSEPEGTKLSQDNDKPAADQEEGRGQSSGKKLVTNDSVTEDAVAQPLNAEDAPNERITEQKSDKVDPLDQEAEQPELSAETVDEVEKSLEVETTQTAKQKRQAEKKARIAEKRRKKALKKQAKQQQILAAKEKIIPQVFTPQDRDEDMDKDPNNDQVSKNNKGSIADFALAKEEHKKQKKPEHAKHASKASSVNPKNQDVDYIGDIKQAVLNESTPGSNMILYTVIIFIIIALIWASVAHVNETTVAVGKVIPSSQISVIQHYEGGILSDLLVAEGQQVEKGQVLLKIDDIRFSSTLEENNKKRLNLLGSIARLRAEAQGKDKVIFPPVLEKEAPEVIEREQQLFDSQISELNNNLDTLRRNYKLAKEELDITEPLVKEGLMSQLDLLRLQREMNELQGKIDKATDEYRADAGKDLNDKESELAQLLETLKAMRDRKQRTTVVSPVKGTVKKINFTTKYATIAPGADIMEIVPTDDTLLVEAKVKPSDIAFIYLGQDALVKVQALDYSIFGGLEGVVEYISADTITDENDEEEKSYYQIRVRTDKNYLERDNERYYIIPGMTVTVDLLGRGRTVLEYLMLPILRAQNSALRER